jgi:hypothetical protein
MSARHTRAFVLGSALLAWGCGRSDIEDKGRFWEWDSSTDVLPEIPCTGDEECDDGLFCNGVETCVEGLCVAGDPPDCDDGVDCTADTCDEETDSCFNLPDHELCPPGMLCDPVLGCYDPGPCTGDEDCDDGLFCNGPERCITGSCTPGTPPSCADALDCTDDSCDEAVDACRNVPRDERCDDALFCNGPEYCDATAGCRHTFVNPCLDDNPCTTELCHEESDTCTYTLRDEDGDRHVDARCGGDDCNDADPTVHPGMAEQCRDLRDNDCDRLVDCDDPECRTDPHCGCVPTEVHEHTCDDGVDNDCDDRVDCDDPDCGCCVPTSWYESSCTNGIDEDCDYLTDCEDPDCDWDPACICIPDEWPEVTCDDGRDNDCDDLVDCEDPDCDCCVPTARWETDCLNGIDEDCDTLLDCGDPDCLGDPACGCVPDEFPEATCDDGRDNDCDGATDCDDGDCDCCIPTSTHETNCSNGVDEDCDGQTDCADVLDCWSDPACRCIPDEIPEATCDDDRDNDCDRLVDCLDPDCATTPECLDNDRCGDAIDISTGGVFRGSTAGYANDYSGTCAGRGPDAVFTLTLTDYACVEMNTFPTTWDTVLYVRDGGCYGPEIGCNDDEPGHGTQSYLRFDVLDPGVYYVFLDGWSSSSFGEYTLELAYCDVCVPSSWYEVDCTNGVDEDCDDLLDCEDPDCAWDPSCACIPDEWWEMTCDDGRDNDCDYLTDCEDPDCDMDPSCACIPDEWWEMTCDDGRDNDCDYLTDCEDPDCDMDPSCICIPDEFFETTCDDGRDNDCDGLTDCEEWSCMWDPACWWW